MTRILLFFFCYALIFLAASTWAGFRCQRRLSSGLFARIGRRPTWDENVRAQNRGAEDPALPAFLHTHPTLSQLVWPLWMSSWIAAMEKGADQVLDDLAPID